MADGNGSTLDDDKVPVKVGNGSLLRAYICFNFGIIRYFAAHSFYTLKFCESLNRNFCQKFAIIKLNIYSSGVVIERFTNTLYVLVWKILLTETADCYVVNA